MLTITDEDILLAERMLLPQGKAFDDERRAVIKCLESKDVLACPGSGKTTALLAKLMSLSRQLPLEDNKGILVLTHTNVAIDTIAQGAGFPAGKLLEYPNHFGTIQSFVDKYVAIPAYAEEFGRRPDKIDKDWYDAKLDQQKKYIGNKALAFCHQNEPKNYPYSIRFSDFGVSAQNECTSLRLDLGIPEKKEIYDRLRDLKQGILKSGILSYDDAYYLASRYVDKHPALRSLFSKRFAYVFIDEMQDTHSDQVNLLDRLFDNSVVMQKIGDINQSIFSFNADNECCWKANEANTLQITGSMRFSNSIAAVIKPICLHPQDLKGNPEIPEIRPTIIAFGDQNIEKVIPRFADLIFEHNLHLEPRRCFKAVGWIAKPHETKHTISSYWPTYERGIQTKNSEYANLASYVARESDEFIRINGARYYKRAIVRALLKSLRVVDKPNGAPLRTETTLFRYLEQKDPGFRNALELKLSEWCLAIHMNQPVVDEISRFVRNQLKLLFGIDDISPLDEFLTGKEVESTSKSADGVKTNIYTHVVSGNSIEVEISTIHGVMAKPILQPCILRLSTTVTTS